MRIYLTALGCRLNQAEIETLGREAARRGHTVVGSPVEADWAIINTCTVTHIAARKSRQAIRRLGRAHPGLRVAVIGCYGETSPREASCLPGVALVAPNLDKEQVLDRIGAVLAEGDPPAQAPAMAECAVLAHLPCERTRAFIKVQDGCENACAYCLVTIARGPARSTPPHEVLAMAQQRRGEGVNEIVLSGVNIGSYGRDSGAAAGWTLARLAQAVLANCDAPRLRFSSIEPWDVSPELLVLWDNPRVCRQLHLPLQSGCDDTLRRMARRMSAAAFAALVSQARAAIPGLAVTADVMVGFPGETEREFEASLRFVEQMAFARLHVFRYSPRPGTPAYALPDQVAPDVALARSQAMAALGHHLAWRFHADLVGRQVEVLFESATVAGGRTFWSGWTDTYVRVRACAEADLANSLRPVMVMAAATDSVSGELA